MGIKENNDLQKPSPKLCPVYLTLLSDFDRLQIMDRVAGETFKPPCFYTGEVKSPPNRLIFLLFTMLED